MLTDYAQGLARLMQPGGKQIVPIRKLAVDLRNFDRTKFRTTGAREKLATAQARISRLDSDAWRGQDDVEREA